jgi:catechol 2,3-dioxygenase-like lactoylglutathione lyase family enzyme
LRRDEELFVDHKFEVIGIPVSDVETAKRFYSDIVGFTMDHDMSRDPTEPCRSRGQAPGLRAGRLGSCDAVA